jgi:hypothetical protein
MLFVISYRVDIGVLPELSNEILKCLNNGVQSYLPPFQLIDKIPV